MVPKSSQNQSSSSNPARRGYVVFLDAAGKAEETGQKISDTVKRGTFYIVPGQNQPEHNGVLYWHVDTDPEEFQALKEAIGDDVSSLNSGLCIFRRRLG